MVQISPAQSPALHALYLKHCAYFPLIAAVLNNTQNGIILADCIENPTQIYVEHAFGFAQIFGRPVPTFERYLHQYLFIDRAFMCEKVRLYTPHYPNFLQENDYKSLQSVRQHFQLDLANGKTINPVNTQKNKDVTLVLANMSHLKMIADTFGVMGRFWRTEDDFINYSNAVIAIVNGQAAALCYAAAIANDKAEIDVLTLPAYRHLGLAKAAVHLFNRHCIAQNLLPLWDCFTNNTASMALCRSTGFIPLDEPYHFFTINR